MTDLVSLQRRQSARPELVDHPGYQPARALDHIETVVPVGLKRAVKRHLARHLSAKMRKRRRGRALVIQGPGGDGKTFGLAKILSDCHVPYISVPASDLCGMHEGAPLEMLDELAAQLPRLHARDGGSTIPVAFDDCELSILIPDEHTEVTCNTPVLQGRMQDELGGINPRLVDSTGLPVPIYILCNDVTGARETLFREGRAIFYNHIVTDSEKIAIATSLFEGAPWVADLVTAHKDQSVAFFAALAGELFDNLLDTIIDTVGLDGAAIDQALPEGLPNVTRETVLAKAETLAASGARNFLQPRQGVEQ